MNVDELVVLKLGGGLITEKSELCTLKPGVINKLAKLISKLTGSGYRIILVHGAGSFGHLKAKKWNLHEGYIEGFKPDDNDEFSKQSEVVESVRNDMMLLNERVVNSLQSFGIQTKSFPPHEWATGVGRNFSGNISIFENNDEYIPVTFGDVVNCNDGTVFGILSGDDICYRIATEMGANHMIFAMGGAPGLMTKPPSMPDSKLIRIWSGDMEFDGEHVSNIDVTGGIYLKLDCAKLIALEVPNVWIVDGEQPTRILEAILSGDTIGTKIIT
ncbi:MAG: hypothetical protein CMA77_03800 [Euryarchaeota archaeon]|nr:hypothetical protein [Euryarchaeota archaeon]